MSIGSRSILLFQAAIIVLFACVPEKESPDFTFPSHSIKLHYDPITHELTAVDTMTVQYHKNVDCIYFFLHKSLHVEGVNVGHQSFAVGPIKDTEVNAMCKNLNEEWRHLVADAQIVAVHIPKSLYSERFEIRYRGKIDLTTEAQSAWHPVLPDSNSDFQVTTIIPNEYVIVSKADVISEDQDEMWRLNRLLVREGRSLCPLQVVQESS